MEPRFTADQLARLKAASFVLKNMSEQQALELWDTFADKLKPGGVMNLRCREIFNAVFPAYVESARHLLANAGSKLTTATDARAEWVMILCHLAGIAQGLPEFAHMETAMQGGKVSPRPFAAKAASSLYKSKIFLWDSDIRTAALTHAPKLPPHKVGDVEWPFPLMWWAYDADVDISGVSEEYQGFDMVGILIEQHPMGIEVTNVVQKTRVGNKMGVMLPILWTYDMVYPDSFENDNNRHFYEGAVSLCGFLQSKLVEQREAYAHRSVRRRHPETLGAPITTITLRYKHSINARNIGGGSQHKDYDYQWMVSGHWRNQWYPTEDRHRLKWIDAYVKGPDGKPLRRAVYKVAR